MVKPILFNTEMVRAILGGRKTVTRRLVKKDGWSILNIPPWGKNIPNGFGDVWFEGRNDDELAIIPIRSPYRPGDVLWVRETWSQSKDGLFLYRAWTGKGQEPEKQDEAMRFLRLKWHPSIHMPREAARIWLRVTNVRVERLQEIDEDGAIAEGLYKGWRLTQSSSLAETARQAFMWLWLHLTRKAPDEMKWSANPWVWVIEFERCEKPEEV